MTIGVRTQYVERVQLEDESGNVPTVTAGALNVAFSSGAVTVSSGAVTATGAAADGAAVSGNPVLVAGQDGTNAQSILTDTTGRQVIVGGAASGATAAGNPILNGGVYTTNANQPAVTTGQAVNLQADAAGNLRTAPQRPTATDVLAGLISHTSTTGATTIVTVAAGRTWVGSITISCDVGIAAASATAGQALGIVSTAGTNVVPAAGNYIACEARAGANAATGTVGSSGANSVTVPFTVVAPVGNTVTIQGTTTIAGTAGRVDYSAAGVLQ